MRDLWGAIQTRDSATSAASLSDQLARMRAAFDPCARKTCFATSSPMVCNLHSDGPPKDRHYRASPAHSDAGGGGSR
jgi:hypothetical protein